jgi:hypothetical protein
MGFTGTGNGLTAVAVWACASSGKIEVAVINAQTLQIRF